MLLSALLATLVVITTANQTILGSHQDEYVSNAVEILKSLTSPEETYPTCSLEKEFLENATDVFSCTEIRQKNPFCARNLKVAFSVLPPYVYLWNGTGGQEVHGLLPEILKDTIIKRCCLGCNKLEFLPVKDSLQKFTDQLITASRHEKADIVIPAEHVGGNREMVFGHHYSKLTSLENIFVIAKSKQRGTKQLVYTLMISAVRSWPLFFVALIMAVCAGTIIWLADMHQNKEQFPRGFPHGPFEGFWWAYVSMTTVGYGDKTPQTIFGRLFAVIWILIGITIFNMFTANITSALNAELLERYQFDPAGKTIGVVKGIKLIKTLVAANQGQAKEFDNIESMIDALEHGNIAGIAVDDITYKFFYKSFINKPFKPQLEWPTKSHSVGFASINMTLKEMQDTVNRNAMDLILYGSHTTATATHETSFEVPDDMPQIANVFSLSNPIFVATIGAVVGTSIVGIVAGIIMNQCNKKKNNVDEDLQELKSSNETSN